MYNYAEANDAWVACSQRNGPEISRRRYFLPTACVGAAQNPLNALQIARNREGRQSERPCQRGRRLKRGRRAGCPGELAAPFCRLWRQARRATCPSGSAPGPVSHSIRAGSLSSLIQAGARPARLLFRSAWNLRASNEESGTSFCADVTSCLNQIFFRKFICPIV